MFRILAVRVPFSPVVWNLYQGRNFIAEFKTKKAAQAALQEIGAASAA